MASVPRALAISPRDSAPSGVIRRSPAGPSGRPGSRGSPCSSPREPGGELLQHPVVAVRVPERGERAVAAPLRVRAGDAVWRAGVVEDAPGVVEHVADVDAVADE